MIPPPLAAVFPVIVQWERAVAPPATAMPPPEYDELPAIVHWVAEKESAMT